MKTGVVEKWVLRLYWREKLQRSGREDKGNDEHFQLFWKRVEGAGCSRICYAHSQSRRRGKGRRRVKGLAASSCSVFGNCCKVPDVAGHVQGSMQEAVQ